MMQAPGDSVQHLKQICVEHSTLTRVTPESEIGGDWTVRNGRLINTRSNYFSLGLYQNGSESQFMFEQPEGALIVLLVSRLAGEEAALIQLRSEPGLIGLTNLTATIQSTPNNFRQEHGGRPTPFMDIVRNPASSGRIVYDGLHYDWGEFYFRKTKRFLVVELGVHMVAPPGFLWVPKDVLARCMFEDHMISTDLRSCFGSWLIGEGADVVSSSAGRHTASLPGLVEGKDILRAVDRRGASLGFYQTVTSTREVTRWSQPLLMNALPIQICLCYRRERGVRLYAVRRATQFGLLGAQLWLPGKLKPGRVVRQSLNSAEGGRFRNSLIDLKVMDVSSDSADALEEDIEWKSEEELYRICRKSLQSSLELRLMISMIAAGKRG